MLRRRWGVWGVARIGAPWGGAVDRLVLSTRDSCAGLAGVVGGAVGKAGHAMRVPGAFSPCWPGVVAPVPQYGGTCAAVFPATMLQHSCGDGLWLLAPRVLSHHASVYHGAGSCRLGAAWEYERVGSFVGVIHLFSVDSIL